jgi:hypothetical protein
MTINLKKQKLDADGVPLITLDSPHDPQDKKPVVVMSPATEGWNTWVTGAGDNLDTGERAGGQPFLLEFEDGYLPQTKILDFDFVENIEVHDGQVSWEPKDNWSKKDKFSLGVYIPATPTTFNPSGTGNANIVNAMGQPGELDSYIIIPAAGDGYYDVDLADGCPVPADGGGFWECNYESGDISYGVPMESAYHLLAVPIQTWLIRNIITTHPGGWFDIDVYKTEWFHKNWKLRWEVYKETQGDGAISGWILAFRKNTQ